MPTQTIVLTDAGGQPATIELRMNHHAVRLLQHLPATGYPSYHNFQLHWQAVTLGALGAQRGGIAIVPGSSNAVYSRADDLILRTQLSRGVPENLVILKRWHTNRGFSSYGTGTLLHGVNLGLQSGEITWSRMDHHHR
jgi:hypothetical protein